MPAVAVGVFLLVAGFSLAVWGYRVPASRRPGHLRTVAFSVIVARLAEERLGTVAVRL
ncbi:MULTISPECIES: hypothetical protein [Actinoalloteichus]|uniref:Uncharacterized protein n=1 Tax=Actinoalloteichus fjordicus TaxID=1612552 RepID=A0AAC9LJH0_9PSEU|nr:MULTISPECIES: hypothetical protein [Actinoalloteichus]APU17470.1 hypothetical protein UA74_27335 [Actinoalloteichus fjordicus]APU23547.1 hypothetical protein UA75_27880 [Actinoalloteichus sp. GBA129-24]